MVKILTFFVALGATLDGSRGANLAANAERTARLPVLTVEPGRTLVLYDHFADLPNTGNTRYPDRPAVTLTLEEGALLKNSASDIQRNT